MPSTCWWRRTLLPRREHPPQWVGLKFFNVYGPNEYHKGKMISVVKVKHDEIAAGGPARLFKSDLPGLADGAQARDFIWVGDVVDVMLWLMETPSVSGLFNLGTGRARTYLDLAHAVSDAAGKPREVEFIDMPAEPGRPVSVVHPGADGAAAGGGLLGPVHAVGGRHPPVRAGPSGRLRQSSYDPGPAVSAVRPGHRPARAAGASAGMRWRISPAW